MHGEIIDVTFLNAQMIINVICTGTDCFLREAEQCDIPSTVQSKFCGENVGMKEVCVCDQGFIHSRQKCAQCLH